MYRRRYIPPAPRSPRPKMRPPSVTTMMSGSKCQLSRMERILFLCLAMEMYIPEVVLKICPKRWQASPTVGVYKIGSSSTTFSSSTL